MPQSANAVPDEDAVADDDRVMELSCSPNFDPKESIEFNAPSMLQDLMLDIEDLTEKDDLDDHSLGMYYAMCTILSTPSANLLEVCKDMMTDIVNGATTGETQDDSVETKDTKITSTPAVTPILETDDDDISDDDLLAEYAPKTADIISEQ